MLIRSSCLFCVSSSCPMSEAIDFKLPIILETCLLVGEVRSSIVMKHTFLKDSITPAVPDSWNILSLYQTLTPNFHPFHLPGHLQLFYNANEKKSRKYVRKEFGVRVCVCVCDCRFFCFCFNCFCFCCVYVCLCISLLFVVCLQKSLLINFFAAGMCVCACLCSLFLLVDFVVVVVDFVVVCTCLSISLLLVVC